MNTQIQRIYKCTDSVMLSSADVIRGIYHEYCTEFATFDPLEFHERFGISFTESINGGFTIERDTLVVDQQTKETAHVEECIEHCIDEYDTLLYYVEKQFKDHLEIQKQFSLHSMSTLRRAHGKLLLVLEEICIAARNNRKVLEEGGYTAEKLQSFIATKNSFRKHYIKQQDALKHRPLKTAERLTLFNSIWGYLVKIHEAAKRIYRHRPEILALFDLPTEHSSHKESPDSTEDKAEQATPSSD